MTTNNHKHSFTTIAKRITQQLVLPFVLSSLIDVVSGLSTVSSHVATRSSARLFMQVQSFRYSPITHYLPHLKEYLLEFGAKFCFHTRRFLRFFLLLYTHIGTYHYSFSVLNYIFCHDFLYVK